MNVNNDFNLVMKEEFNKKYFNTIVDKNNDNNEENSNKNIANKNFEKINDKYEKIKVIGKGTFGLVYKIKDLNNKIFALKKVLQEPEYKNRELEIIKIINHPNIIKMYDYFYSKNNKDIYLNWVTNYVPENLLDIINYYYKSKMKFPNTLAKIYFYQMLRGISYLHRKNICHRDIKASNILINMKNHELKLCDLGSAKILNTNEKSLNYICNRYYRAPELILDTNKYGCNIDLWSIGCLMAEAFLGRPLFMGSSTKNQLIEILKLLGTPDLEDLKGMNLKKIINLPNYKKIGLENKLKNVDKLAIDLIWRLLVYNPKKREDPFELLSHPYFDELRAKRIEINSIKIIDLFNFKENEFKNRQELKSKLIPKWYKKSK